MYLSCEVSSMLIQKIKGVEFKWVHSASKVKLVNSILNMMKMRMRSLLNAPAANEDYMI